MHCRQQRAAVVTGLILSVWVSATFAKHWSPQSFPNPVTDTRLCGRNGKSSWICDPDLILSPHTQNVIEGIIHDIAVPTAPYGPSACPNLPEGAAGHQVGTPHQQATKHKAFKPAWWSVSSICVQTVDTLHDFAGSCCSCAKHEA